MGGPGKWLKKGEAITDDARCYQCQITGAPPGWVYEVDGVAFDSYKNGVLIDAKNRYAQFFDNAGRPLAWFKTTGWESMRKEALAQLRATKGAPVQWHFAEAKVAEAVQRIIELMAELKGLTIVHTPPIK